VLRIPTCWKNGLQKRRTSTLTSASVKRLGLAEGMEIASIIKASDVLLAIDKLAVCKKQVPVV
jgi:hypothetical protein